MLNVDNSTLDNIMAASRSSAVGQMFGRITGSNEQSIRSSIKKLKPLIVQDIRRATDMGARGLDSEKELEFYLQAATDEKTDIQSNIAAIVVLDEAYGTGKVAEKLRSLTNQSLIKRISDEGALILNGGGKAESEVVNTLPPGSKLIGTSGGKNVYQTPDGSKFIEE
jgi:DNA-binding phage protein